MKKTLLSLLAVALFALNGNALGKTSPQDVYKSIIASEPRTTSYFDFIGIYGSTRKIKSDKGYELEVTANEGLDVPDGNGKKSLRFKIKDEATTVCIYDTNLDGFNEEDSLSISHKFKNGDRLFVNLQNKDKKDYEIVVDLFDKEDNSYAVTSVETAELGWIERKIVDGKSKPILNLSKELYQNMLDSAYKSKAADLPCEDVKEALKDVEEILPLIKAGKKEANSALLKLADSYTKLAKQRSAQLRKLEERK